MTDQNERDPLANQEGVEDEAKTRKDRDTHWYTPQAELSTPSTATDDEELEEPPIGGFWVRLLALVADVFLLGLAALVLGLALHQQFVYLGGWGRFLGFLIAIAYFGYFNSRLRHGQTPGKRLMKLRVVNLRGEQITPGKSFLRAAVFLTPLYLSQVLLPHAAWATPLDAGRSLLILILLGGTAYLFLFNRGTRQVLHDILCDTLVVTADAAGAPKIKPIPLVHYVVLGGLCVFVFAPMAMLTTLFGADASDIVNLQQGLREVPGVTRATVYGGKTRGFRTLVIDLYCAEMPDAPADTMLEAAKITLNSYSDARMLTALSITVRSGYDVGIASLYHSVASSASPQQWQEQMLRAAEVRDQGSSKIVPLRTFPNTGIGVFFAPAL